VEIKKISTLFLEPIVSFLTGLEDMGSRGEISNYPVSHTHLAKIIICDLEGFSYGGSH